LEKGGSGKNSEGSGNVLTK